MNVEKIQYRLLIIKLFKFLIILLLFEFIVGGLVQWLFFNQESGKYARLNYTMSVANEDIVIFGSSHANRHFDPNVFENKLGLSCYNAGVQGQELLFVSTLFKILCERDTPKIIILNIDKNWLFYSQDGYDRLSEIEPYYSIFPNEIGDVLNRKGSFEKIKLMLKLYRFNSTIIHILKYKFFPQTDIKGYRPLIGEIKTFNKDFSSDVNRYTKLIIDSNCISALEQIIEISKAKNIKLYTTISPYFYSTDESKNISYLKLIEILNKNEIPIFNYLNDTSFCLKNNLFHDFSHLNKSGAKHFSEIVSNEISKNIN